MKKEILITQEGLEKLQEELNELVTDKRPEIINRIKVAKELGDLSENAEYTSAKDEQSFVEGRIQELEQVIKQAKVVNASHSGTISIGSTIEFEVEGEKDSFEIVGPTEFDPSHGKISVDSPVGQALLGHKAGSRVNVETPEGKIIYKIINVT